MLMLQAHGPHLQWHDSRAGTGLWSLVGAAGHLTLPARLRNGRVRNVPWNLLASQQGLLTSQPLNSITMYSALGAVRNNGRTLWQGQIFFLSNLGRHGFTVRQPSLSFPDCKAWCFICHLAIYYLYFYFLLSIYLSSIIYQLLSISIYFLIYYLYLYIFYYLSSFNTYYLYIYPPVFVYLLLLSSFSIFYLLPINYLLLFSCLVVSDSFVIP